MTSFLAYQNHVLGMSQVRESMNQQLLKKLSLKSMFMVKKGKMTRLQLTFLLVHWVLLTNKSTVQISKLFLKRLKTWKKKQEKKLDSLVSFHMPFLKMLYLWMKLKALTVRCHLSGI